MSLQWSVSGVAFALGVICVTLGYITWDILLLTWMTKKAMKKVGIFRPFSIIKVVLISCLMIVTASILITISYKLIIYGSISIEMDSRPGIPFILPTIACAFIAATALYIFENNYMMGTGNKGLTFRDKNSNLYTFEAIGTKTRMTVLDTEGNLLSTDHIDPKLLKTLEVASRRSNLALAYALSKIPEDSIQHVSKIRLPKEDHLIMQLIKKKDSGNSATYASLLLAIISEFVLFSRYHESYMLFALSLTSILLLFSYINQRIFKYRVECGLYGTCEAEAREIIAFILEWRKKNSDSDSDLPKLVFKEEELVERVLRTDGGEEYAG